MEDQVKKLTQDWEGNLAKVDTWKKLLQLVVSVDRVAKPDDTPWSVHFTTLLQEDLQEVPSCFDDSGLEFPDLVVKLSGHISQLLKRAEKSKNILENAKKKQVQKHQGMQKMKATAEEKVEEIVKNPGVVKEKVNKRRCLGWQ